MSSPRAAPLPVLLAAALSIPLAPGCASRDLKLLEDIAGCLGSENFCALNPFDWAELFRPSERTAGARASAEPAAGPAYGRVIPPPPRDGGQEMLVPRTLRQARRASHRVLSTFPKDHWLRTRDSNGEHLRNPIGGKEVRLSWEAVAADVTRVAVIYSEGGVSETQLQWVEGRLLLEVRRELGLPDPPPRERGTSAAAPAGP